MIDKRAARVVSLTREAPVGFAGRNWWRAVIHVRGGTPVTHYVRGTKAEAQRAARRTVEQCSRIHSDGRPFIFSEASPVYVVRRS